MKLSLRTIFLLALLYPFLMSPLFIVNAKEINKFSTYKKNLKNKDENIRREAAESLGKLKDVRAVSSLIRALKDKDLKVRVSAANALGFLGHKKAIKPLIKLAETDREAAPLAIRSLGRIEDPSATAYLKKVLFRNDSLLVFEAALALSQHDREDITAAFLEALPETDDYGCQTIVNILGRKKIQKSVSALLQVSRGAGSRPGCQRSAIEALGLIGNAQAIPTLEGILASSGSDQIKARVLVAFGRLKADQMYSVLVSFLDNSKPLFRRSAVESLVYLGDRRIIPHLKKMTKDPDPSVRSIVEYSLGQFGAL